MRRAILLAAAIACGGSDGTVDPPPPNPGRPVLPQTYRASGRAAAGDAFVHLFEWRWIDVAEECERVLGPSGFKAVQVSPPQEHVAVVGFPWWVRYQPVSYNIDRSRSGSRAEFVAMVGRCRQAGVDVYVDAVINHMTAGAGTGSNGTVYTKYSYPGLYGADDFHTACAISNYLNPANVQDCELVGLADLRTESAAVQQKIADYLTGLVRLGVAGFRIDAAKHIQPVQLDSILTKVNRTLAAEGRSLPYVFAEVIDPGTEAVRATDYYGLGYASGGAADITEFKFRGVGDRFLATGSQRLAGLSAFSPSTWALMPADKAVVFLENHDTQRNGGIGYRDPVVYRLANIWMLAQPYGYPSIMSSYAFDRNSQAGRDAGPPSNGAGETSHVTCAARLELVAPGDWVCEHRDPVIARMVAFRRAVAGTDVNRTWDNERNAVAFSRGNRGFVAINGESVAIDTIVVSAMATGTYCDVLTGGVRGTACAGTSVSVNAFGGVRVQLAPNSAIAIHTGARP